jgi:hypothetical protein
MKCICDHSSMNCVGQEGFCPHCVLHSPIVQNHVICLDSEMPCQIAKSKIKCVEFCTVEPMKEV